jgi:hypothetical protein
LCALFGAVAGMGVAMGEQGGDVSGASSMQVGGDQVA